MKVVVAGRRKRELLRRGVTRVGRMGVFAASAGFGVDARVLGVSCGFALRAALATFWVVSVVLEKIALWAVLRAYGFAIWTMRTVVALLD